MALYTLDDTKLRIEIAPAKGHPVPGGQVAARAPRAVWARHDLKGERERLFSQRLADLDLHHPPCLARIANQTCQTLAALRAPRFAPSGCMPNQIVRVEAGRKPGFCFAVG